MRTKPKQPPPALAWEPRRRGPNKKAKEMTYKPWGNYTPFVTFRSNQNGPEEIVNVLQIEYVQHHDGENVAVHLASGAILRMDYPTFAAIGDRVMTLYPQPDAESGRASE
jgi:hypothetical protein